MLMVEPEQDDRRLEASLQLSLAQRLRAVAESYEEIAELHRLLADLHERRSRGGSTDRDPQS